MYVGKLVEISDTQTLFKNPQLPYTEASLSAVPTPDPLASKQIILAGDVPSPIKPPSGGGFHARWPYLMDQRRPEEPPLKQVASGHQIACNLRDAVSYSVNQQQTYKKKPLQNMRPGGVQF